MGHINRGADLALYASPPGQCRLAMTDATHIKLSQFNGQNLVIDGALEQIPSAGVTVTNAGLAASTLYYVYAYMSAGVMTLELSATGHSASTNGVEIKTGDSSRTLVGMIRTNGSTPGQFLDGATDICVLSWFNRKRKTGKAKFTANRTVAASAGVFAEVNAELRVNFLSWADEPVRQAITGAWAVTGAATGHGYCSIDGSTSGQRSWGTTSTATTTTFASVDETTVAEGYHYGTMVGNCNAGTSVTWLGNQNGELGQVLTVMG